MALDYWQVTKKKHRHIRYSDISWCSERGQSSYCYFMTKGKHHPNPSNAPFGKNKSLCLRQVETDKKARQEKQVRLWRKKAMILYWHFEYIRAILYLHAWEEQRNTRCEISVATFFHSFLTIFCFVFCFSILIASQCFFFSWLVASGYVRLKSLFDEHGHV